jgi:hypothetical protein
MKSKLFLLSSLLLLSCGKNKPTTEQKDTTQTDTSQANMVTEETLCFNLEENVDVSEDQKGKGEKMNIKTDIQLTIKGDVVTGTVAEERLVNKSNVDAAGGDLKGTRKGDTLYLDYTYTIEGYTGTEEVIYVLKGDKLAEGSGELVDKGGKMVLKDPAKATFDKVYTKGECK